MYIYVYDDITREYLYKDTVEKDPEESRKQGKFVPLVPAYATLLEPLDAKEGYAVVFNSNWEYIEDNRGEKVINPETEEIVVVDYLGALQTGFVPYNEYIESEEYQEKKKKEEYERLQQSNMTKLDFVNELEAYGITYYEHIVPLLNSNLEARKQWDLCERVYRFNPLLDGLALTFGITSEQLDEIFKKRGA